MPLADSYRNYHVKFIAIFLAIILIWALFQTASMPVLVNRKNINAIVLEINESAGDKHSLSILVLELPDKRTCKVINNYKLKPRISNLVPLYLEVYDNGNEICVINSQVIILD